MPISASLRRLLQRFGRASNMSRFPKTAMTATKVERRFAAERRFPTERRFAVERRFPTGLARPTALSRLETSAPAWREDLRDLPGGGPSPGKPQTSWRILSRGLVAQVSNLLYRRFSICKPLPLRTACRMKFGATAGWQPALPPHGTSCPAPGHQGESSQIKPARKPVRFHRPRFLSMNRRAGVLARFGRPDGTRRITRDNIPAAQSGRGRPRAAPLRFMAPMGVQNLGSRLPINRVAADVSPRRLNAN